MVKNTNIGSVLGQMLNEWRTTSLRLVANGQRYFHDTPIRRAIRSGGLAAYHSRSAL